MRFSPEAMCKFSVAALVAAGADQTEAQLQAEIMSWSDCAGRDTQGIWRLPMMVERLQKKLHHSPANIQIKLVAPAVATMDGDAGLGYVVAHKAMSKAIEIAQSQGIGCVAVRNASHLGAAGYFVNQAAQAGVIGLCFSNSVPKVIPPNGTKRVWGTNPIAIGCPRQNQEHVIIDMATAASAGSTITQAKQLGKPLSESVIVTKDGTRSSDAKDAAEGGVQPMAGAKGFALGFAVELLSGVITSAGITHQLRSMHNDMSGPAENGHLMIALSVESLMPMDIYYARLEHLIAEVHAAGGRIPGEHRWEAYQKNLASGFELTPVLAKQLMTLANALSIDFPSSL